MRVEIRRRPPLLVGQNIEKGSRGKNTVLVIRDEMEGTGIHGVCTSSRSAAT